MTDDYGIPFGRVLAGANQHGSPLLAPTLALDGTQHAIAGRFRLIQDCTVKDL